MLLIMNKEVMRITVNSAYEFVYFYEKHIKTKNSFSTPLFYLQTDIDDLAITLKSDDNDFVNRCGVTPKIINKKLFYGADVYVSYDENNLALITKCNDDTIADISMLCIGRFYRKGISYIYVYNRISVSHDTIVFVYKEDDHTKLWSSVSGMCTSTALYSDNTVNHIPNYRDMLINDTHKVNGEVKIDAHKRSGDVNCLNEITTVLPVYFFVKDTPKSMGLWKYIGGTDFFGMISMYNMSTFHISQIDYPVLGERYLCCAFFKRRTSDFGGVAIRLSNLLESESSNLIDFDSMQRNTSGKVLNIYNSDTGIIAYGGDCTFLDGTPGNSIEFTEDIYKYDKLIIEYTDDSGNYLHTVTIKTSYLLDNSNNSTFDLLMGNTFGLFWQIDLTKSTGVFFSGVAQNSGLVSIRGIISKVEDDFNELPSIQ